MKKFLRKFNSLTRYTEKHFRKMIKEVQKLNNALDAQIVYLKIV